MNKFVLAWIGIFGATAVAADDVNEIIDAASDGNVAISNTAGSVEVQGWSRNQVEVIGELGSGVDELIFERDGDDVIIKVKVPRNSRNIGSDLHINVPEASSLRINTVSADVDVADVTGEQRIETVSGDIETTVAAEDVEIGSVSGDIEVEGDDEAIRSRLNTVSGDVDADHLAGEIAAEAVSGDLTIVNGVFERASINTVNGDIIFQARLLDDGRLDVETINGEVDVEFDGDVSARFDIETFNGDINNCFGPEPVRVSKYTPGYELKFTEGGGSGRVTVKTLNGDLRLCN